MSLLQGRGDLSSECRAAGHLLEVTQPLYLVQLVSWGAMLSVD